MSKHINLTYYVPEKEKKKIQQKKIQYEVCIN